MEIEWLDLVMHADMARCKAIEDNNKAAEMYWIV